MIDPRTDATGAPAGWRDADLGGKAAAVAALAALAGYAALLLVPLLPWLGRLLGT